jgi:hypothetical protein
MQFASVFYVLGNLGGARQKKGALRGPNESILNVARGSPYREIAKTNLATWPTFCSPKTNKIETSQKFNPPTWPNDDGCNNIQSPIF